jgi:hypothetical protein
MSDGQQEGAAPFFNVFESCLSDVHPFVPPSNQAGHILHLLLLQRALELGTSSVFTIIIAVHCTISSNVSGDPMRGGAKDWQPSQHGQRRFGMCRSGDWVRHSRHECAPLLSHIVPSCKGNAAQASE